MPNPGLAGTVVSPVNPTTNPGTNPGDARAHRELLLDSSLTQLARTAEIGCGLLPYLRGLQGARADRARPIQGGP